MLKYGTESASELLSKLMTLSHFMNASLNLEKEDDDVYDAGVKPSSKPLIFNCVSDSDFVNVIEIKTLVSLATPASIGKDIHGTDKGLPQLKTVIDDAAKRLGPIPITLTDILAFTVKQRTALAALVEESSKFVRYPALMWPVTYGKDGASDNHGCFTPVKKDRSSGNKSTHSDMTRIAKDISRIARVAEVAVSVMSELQPPNMLGRVEGAAELKQAIEEFKVRVAGGKPEEAAAPAAGGGGP